VLPFHGAIFAGMAARITAAAEVPAAEAPADSVHNSSESQASSHDRPGTARPPEPTTSVVEEL
jgi:hypothetical protein